MTSKSPSDIAAELYPYPKDGSPLDDHITELIREAWLSRQTEVDRLQKTIDGLLETGSSKLSNKQNNALRAEVDELKRQVEELQKGSYSYWYRKWKNADDQLAAKEKECEELQKKYIEMSNAVSGEYRDMVIKYQSQIRELKSTHDAEMCAFREWLGVDYGNQDRIPELKKQVDDNMTLHSIAVKKWNECKDQLAAKEKEVVDMEKSYLDSLDYKDKLYQDLNDNFEHSANQALVERMDFENKIEAQDVLIENLKTLNKVQKDLIEQLLKNANKWKKDAKEWEDAHDYIFKAYQDLGEQLMKDNIPPPPPPPPEDRVVIDGDTKILMIVLVIIFALGLVMLVDIINLR